MTGSIPTVSIPGEGEKYEYYVKERKLVGKKEGKKNTPTIPVPGEGVPQLGALYFHVQANGHQIFFKVRIIHQLIRL